MKTQLTGRPRISAFDLEPGQAFLSNARVYLAIVPSTTTQGKPFNAVSLEGGSLFHFGPEIEVELVHGSFVEDDLTTNVEI
jgi:hypothetical protein